MRATQLLLTTTKETPADASIISHQLMLRAAMIKPLASGLYHWLPLGLRVVRKVEAIVREAMNDLHAQELLMPMVQPAQLWQQSKRWEQYGAELLRFNDRHDNAFCLGPTHEELVTDLVRQEVNSYKSLPLTLYQIQTKFRDEIRPRFGVMRAREFLMKDAYSFHLTEDCLQSCYDAMYAAYERIFKRLGLDFRAVAADNGAIGGNVSHEFHVLAESGEDALAISDSGPFAANVETLDNCQAGDPSPDGQGHLQIKRGIEIGHIFQLGDNYSRALQATVLDQTGKKKPLLMGCYGIGITRIVAASIEQKHDDKGMIWSPAMAPFHIAIVPLNMKKSTSVCEYANKLYGILTEQGYEVLLDDRDQHPGAKFADMDLIGIPHRLVVSERNLKNQQLEYKSRCADDSQLIPEDDALAFVKQQLSASQYVTTLPCSKERPSLGYFD